MGPGVVNETPSSSINMSNICYGAVVINPRRYQEGYLDVGVWRFVTWIDAGGDQLGLDYDRVMPRV